MTCMFPALRELGKTWVLAIALDVYSVGLKVFALVRKHIGSPVATLEDL